MAGSVTIPMFNIIVEKEQKYFRFFGRGCRLFRNVNSCTQTGTQTRRQANRQTDRQTGRQTNRQADRQKDRQTGRQADRQ